MALYQANRAHLFLAGAQKGYILCQCGEAAPLSEGSHPNCDKPGLLWGGRAESAGFPTCRHCGFKISHRNPGGSTKIVTNAITGRAHWAVVGCSPVCPGYAYDGVNIAAPMPVPVRETVICPHSAELQSDPQFAQRCVVLRERIRSAMAVASALKHDLAFVEKLTLTPGLLFLDLKCQKEGCEDKVRIDLRTMPDDPVRGPAVMFLCRAAGPKNE